jgi:hypothetical protein
LSTPAPSITISDVSRSEGQSGQTAFVFTVSLSRARNAVIADAQRPGTILNDVGGSGGGCNPSVPCDPLPPPDDGY